MSRQGKASVAPKSGAWPRSITVSTHAVVMEKGAQRRPRRGPQPLVGQNQGEATPWAQQPQGALDKTRAEVSLAVGGGVSAQQGRGLGVPGEAPEGWVADDHVEVREIEVWGQGVFSAELGGGAQLCEGALRQRQGVGVEIEAPERLMLEPPEPLGIRRAAASADLLLGLVPGRLERAPSLDEQRPGAAGWIEHGEPAERLAVGLPGGSRRVRPRS
jgi:hypothetical protein